MLTVFVRYYGTIVFRPTTPGLDGGIELEMVYFLVLSIIDMPCQLGQARSPGFSSTRTSGMEILEMVARI